MNLHELVSQLIVDTKGAATGLSFTPDSSVGAFLPEIVLCCTIVLLLLVRVIKGLERFDVSLIALLGSAVAMYFAAPWNLLVPDAVYRMEMFTGMLVYDGFTVFLRGILLLFAILFVVFTRLSGIPDREDGPDIYSLVLGSTLGMCLMASANHLLMVFMAIEMASVPSYALAGMLKGRREGSEAALKYSVYGAGAAGVMLYGISLLAGLLHTAHLPTMTIQLATLLPTMDGSERMVLAIAGLMIGVGVAFKLSAVPFHFWCPDVFEGASAEVAAFLSISSKAAALALLVRLAVSVAGLPPAGVEPGARTAAAAPAVARIETGSFAVADDDPATAAADQDEAVAPEPGSADDPGLFAALAPARKFVGLLIAMIAILTCTFGNLAAYAQTNIKRLLAYSTIAHAGYMMMAVPPVVALAGTDNAAAQYALAGLGIYITVYLFMNLGAFAIVAFIRNELRSEQIADYAGLIKRAPGVVICLSLILFSLVGLPPLAGFLGKFAVFAAIASGYLKTGELYLIVLLVAGGINTAISLFYYLRVVRVMAMEPEPDDRLPFSFPLVSFSGMFVLAVTVPTVVLIACWNTLGELAQAAASHLLS